MTDPPDLLTYLAELPDPRPDADGATFDAEQDHDRLATLAERVWAAMRDGAWHTLAELAGHCRGSEASVSARLRDFRKPEWGGHIVDRRRHATIAGLWEYHLIVRAPDLDQQS